jgi:peptidoglycan/LPS O-acetylase OafA/YrhL
MMPKAAAISVPRSGFFAELQSLRGLAACAVLMGHAANMYDQPQAFYTAAWVFNGRGAVVLFFVLSGYVLTRSLRNDPFTSESVLSFYVRRVARIYPAIWVVSTLSLVYLFALHPLIPVPDASAFFLSRYRPDRMNLLYVGASYAGLSPFLMPQLWSITIEIVASMAMPLMAHAAYHRVRLFHGLGAATLILCFMGQWTLYGVSFFAGTWLARNTKWQQKCFSVFGKSSTRAATAVGLLFPFTQFLPFSYSSPVAALIETGLSTLLIGFVVYSDCNLELLRFRSFVFLGDISYSLYLVHFLVASFLLKIFAVTGIMARLGFAGISKSLLLIGATLVVCIPLSWLLYSVVEVPGIRAGRRLSSDFSRQQQAVIG